MVQQQMNGSLSIRSKQRWLFVAVACVSVFSLTTCARGAPRTDEERVAFWIEKLAADNDATVRAYAAAMLGQIADADADQSTLIETLMADPDIHVRTNAATALGRIGGETLLRSVDALLTAMKHDDAGLRSNAAMALAGVDPSLPADHVDALIVALGDVTLEVSVYCATALAKIGAPAIDDLVAALADPDQKAGAASALSQILDEIPPDHLPALVNGLADDDARVRRGCAQVLGRIGDAVVPDLVKVLDSGPQHAKIAAVVALTQLALLDATQLIPHVAVLIKALDDESNEVRAPCATMLGEMGSAAEAQLTITLATGSGHARAGAAKALALIVPHVSEEYVPNLVAGLGDMQSLVRRSCRLAIANVGPMAGLDLIKALDPNSEAKNRLEILNSLIEIGPHADALVAVLLQALKDEDVYVRLRAVEVVRDEVGSNSDIVSAAMIDRFENDPEVSVQLAAIGALVVNPWGGRANEAYWHAARNAGGRFGLGHFGAVIRRRH